LDESALQGVAMTMTRELMHRFPVLLLALFIVSCGAEAQTQGTSLLPSDDGAIATRHFDPLGKMPSKFTIELRNGLKAELPFADKRDYDEAKQGFIAEPPYTKIMAGAGHVAWDMGSYGWLLSGKDFESIHPSLQRQAILNMAYGLYESCRAEFIRSAATTLPTSASSRAIPDGLSSTR
jgi:hypothetical protein